MVRRADDGVRDHHHRAGADGELGIDADDWPKRLTKEQRQAPAVRIYMYLTGLQAALLDEGFDLDQADMA